MQRISRWFMVFAAVLIAAQAAWADHPRPRKSLVTKVRYDKEYRRVVATGYFKGADGKPVRYRQYVPVGPSRATVVFLNGRSEFIEKYDVLFSGLHQYPDGPAQPDETLADLPVTFVTLDHEGQGKLFGRIGGHIDDFNHYVNDVKRLFKTVPALRHHRQPVFLMAHSMGGLVATRFAQEHKNLVDGLMLSAPLLGFATPPGLEAGQLEVIAHSFAAPPEEGGLGLPKACAIPEQIPGIPPELVQPLVAALGLVQANEAARPCLNNPTLPGCENPPIPGVTFGLLNYVLTYIQSATQASPGCPVKSDVCTADVDSDLTTDFEYGKWTQCHPLHGRDPTFGWFRQNFHAQAAFYDAARSIEMPTLLMVDSGDHVIDAKRVQCNDPFVGECTKVPFDGLLHELFATGARAGPINEVREFIKTQIGSRQ